MTTTETTVPNMTGAQRLFYMRSGNRTVTIAYKIEKMNGNGATVRFSYSSNRITEKEKDTFNKKFGREIATGRLSACRENSTFTCEVSDVRKANLEIAQFISKQSGSKIPTAISKVARAYLSMT